MSGALTLMLGDRGPSTPSGGTPGALAWNNIYGPATGGIGVTNFQTISGITGLVTISLVVTGTANIFYWSAGANHWYNGGLGTGPFTAANGDAIQWGAENVGFGSSSGTVSVYLNGVLVDTFNYVVFQ